MIFNRRLAVIVSLVSLFILVSIASAGPAAPGAPTLRWRATSDPNVSEIRADGITNGGTTGNGAISWDIYFRFPNTVSSPYPGLSITAGPAWTAMSPCGFSTNISTGLPSDPGGTGDRGVIINGFCASGVPNNPVTGNDVLVATINVTGCTGGFVMDMDTGAAVFGAAVTDMFDRSNDRYVFSDSDLTDGGVCGNPTAVTLGNISAGPVAPLSNGLYVAAAGALALLAAAGIALRGIRKH